MLIKSKLLNGYSITGGNDMKHIILLLSLVIMLLVSSTVPATTICATSDVTLSTIQLAYDPLSLDPIPTIIDVSSTNSSECIGLLSGNDNPAPSGNNIGEYGDGLLNGEVQTGGNADPTLSPDNTLFDPLYNPDPVYNPDLVFIEPSDLQDFDDDTVNTDPGWVYLGKDDGVGFDYATTGNGLSEINIFDVVDIDFFCDGGGSIDGCIIGTWSIMPDFDIAATLFDLFGEGVFDHLALVFKSGNVDTTTPGADWTIYDFNFNTLFGGGLDLTMPYNLKGTFDMTDIFDGHGISHISTWARDPTFDNTTTTVSEPRASLLMLFGMILILLRYKITRVAL
jgi:hypothetical protein